MEDGWHAICQAICNGVEAPEWEVMCYEHVGTHTTVQLKKPGIKKKARAQWALKDAATMTQVASVELRVEPKCGKHCRKRT